jgi:Fe-S-cluster containining protein
MKKSWYSEGLQFACQGSGKCCTSHGEFGFVYLTLADRKRMALYFGISEAEFRRQHCRNVDGFWALNDAGVMPNFDKTQAAANDCQFLKDKRCSIYEARPTQCRTWPFWPEVMSARKWKKEVETFCPGVQPGAKGLKTYSAREIDTAIAEQKLAELEMRLEASKRK